MATSQLGVRLLVRISGLPGGQIRMLGQLRLGEVASRPTGLVDTVNKDGRTCRQTFLTGNGQISQSGAIVIDERWDIVHRDASAGGPPGSGDDIETPATEGDWSIDVPPPLLLWFAALTYNRHRIQYDRDHAREIEGYPWSSHPPPTAGPDDVRGRPEPLGHNRTNPDQLPSGRDKFGRQAATGEMTRLN